MNNYGWGKIRTLSYWMPFRGLIYILSQVHLRPPEGHRTGDNMSCLFLPCGMQVMALDRTTVLYNPFLFAYWKEGCANIRKIGEIEISGKYLFVTLISKYRLTIFLHFVNVSYCLFKCFHHSMSWLFWIYMFRWYLRAQLSSKWFH